MLLAVVYFEVDILYICIEMFIVVLDPVLQ